MVSAKAATAAAGIELLRPPKVYSTAHFRLSDNVENLILQGNADLQGYGNGLSNALYGNSGLLPACTSGFAARRKAAGNAILFKQNHDLFT